MLPRQARLLAILGCIGLAGCATLVKGRTQEIGVTTVPAGASVVVNGVMMGPTPLRVTFKRKETSAILRIEMTGYQPVTVALKRGTSKWIAADVILGLSQLANQGPSHYRDDLIAAGVIPVVTIGIDRLTGAAFTLNPATVHVVLERIE